MSDDQARDAAEFSVFCKHGVCHCDGCGGDCEECETDAIAIGHESETVAQLSAYREALVEAKGDMTYIERISRSARDRGLQLSSTAICEAAQDALSKIDSALEGK